MKIHMLLEHFVFLQEIYVTVDVTSSYFYLLILILDISEQMIVQINDMRHSTKQN